MKLFALLLALALGLTACTAPAAETTTPEATAETTTAAETAPAVDEPALPEGFAPAEDADAIEEQLGLLFTLPQRAEDVTLGVVDGKYAFAAFAFEGATYQYSMGLEAVHPADGPYAHEEEADWMDFPYTLLWNDDGSGAACWSDPTTGAACQLTAQGVTRDTLAEMAVLLLPAA